MEIKVPGLDFIIRNEEDFLRVKKFLGSRTPEELEKINQKQIRTVTKQTLLVNQTGIPFARLFIDGSGERINKDFLRSQGWSPMDEVPFTGDLKKTTNYVSKTYWSCGCKKDYIHHRNQFRCLKCGLPVEEDTKRYKNIETLGNW